jgi:ankyrin repeat protein
MKNTETQRHKGTKARFENYLMRALVPLCLCVSVFSHTAAPILAQSSKDSLANLIEAGNRKAALERIRAGADVNMAQPDGTRPIHWAVYRVDYELLEALIAKKANVNAKNEFGSTPIAEAAKLADARMAKMLLNAGAEPEGANPDGQTALMLAIKTGEVAIVDMLIKAGANVNMIERFHNQTPLMWAAAAPRNAGEMVKLLLAKGADVKPRALYSVWPSQITSEPRAQYRPVGGLTALLYAARRRRCECTDA